MVQFHLGPEDISGSGRHAAALSRQRLENLCVDQSLYRPEVPAIRGRDEAGIPDEKDKRGRMADGYVAGRNGTGGFHKSRRSGMVSDKAEDASGHGRGLLQNGFR